MCHPLRVKAIENQIVPVDTPDKTSCTCFISAILLSCPWELDPQKDGIKIKCAIYPHFTL